jgi:glutamine synthetase
MSDGLGLGLGSAGFVERHGLYSDEQARTGAGVAARIEELGLRTVRLVLVDQHGVARSKHVSGAGAIAAMHNGADFSGAIYSLDTGNRVFPPPSSRAGALGSTSSRASPTSSWCPTRPRFKCCRGRIARAG